MYTWRLFMTCYLVPYCTVTTLVLWRSGCFYTAAEQCGYQRATTQLLQHTVQMLLHGISAVVWCCRSQQSFCVNVSCRLLTGVKDLAWRSGTELQQRLDHFFPSSFFNQWICNTTFCKSGKSHTANNILNLRQLRIYVRQNAVILIY